MGSLRQAHLEARWLRDSGRRRGTEQGCRENISRGLKKNIRGTKDGTKDSDSHGSEAQPLCSELGNTKQAGSTFECLQLSAAANGVAGWCYGKDVGEASGGRSGAQQDEIGRYAFGGAARDDAIVLGKIRDQKADENDAAEDCQNLCQKEAIQGGGQLTWKQSARYRRAS